MGIWKSARRRWCGWSLPTRLGLGLGVFGVFVSMSAWVWPDFWRELKGEGRGATKPSSLATRAESRRGEPSIIPMTQKDEPSPKSHQRPSPTSSYAANALPADRVARGTLVSHRPRTWTSGENSSANGPVTRVEIETLTANPIPAPSEVTKHVSSASGMAEASGPTRTSPLANGPTSDANLGRQGTPVFLRHTTGTVKWFSSAKGYGFISDASGRDVFVHFSEISEPGYRSLEEGGVVEFDVLMGPKGAQAHNVKVRHAND